MNQQSEKIDLSADSTKNKMIENTQNSYYKWYVLKSVSGSELNLKKKIEDQIYLKKKQDFLKEIRTLEVEQSKSQKSGNLISRKKSLIQGYILIKMHMTNEMNALILSVAKPCSFLSSDKKPVSLTEKEVENFCDKVLESYDDLVESTFYKVDSKVSVLSGPFRGLYGIINHVDNDNNELKVSVSIFNKLTEIQLSFDDVKIVE